MMIKMIHDCTATGVNSGWNGGYTAMWKASGKSTTLLLSLDSVFPKTEINAKLFLWRQNFVRGSTRAHSVDSEGATNL
jgi:hypothetical protein